MEENKLDSVMDQIYAFGNKAWLWFEENSIVDFFSDFTGNVYLVLLIPFFVLIFIFLIFRWRKEKKAKLLRQKALMEALEDEDPDENTLIVEREEWPPLEDEDDVPLITPETHPESEAEFIDEETSDQTLIENFDEAIPELQPETEPVQEPTEPALSSPMPSSIEKEFLDIEEELKKLDLSVAQKSTLDEKEISSQPDEDHLETLDLNIPSSQNDENEDIEDVAKEDEDFSFNYDSFVEETVDTKGELDNEEILSGELDEGVDDELVEVLKNFHDDLQEIDKPPTDKTADDIDNIIDEINESSRDTQDAGIENNMDLSPLAEQTSEKIESSMEDEISQLEHLQEDLESRFQSYALENIAKKTTELVDSLNKNPVTSNDDLEVENNSKSFKTLESLLFTKKQKRNP